MKKIIMAECCSCILAVALFIVLAFNNATIIFADEMYLDVPADNWAAGDINELRSLGIVFGSGDRFGLGKSISHGELIEYLGKLFSWDSSGYTESMSTPVTREKLAVMIVAALGYDLLAQQMSFLDHPFTDIAQNTGHITLITDFGIMSGVGGDLFAPDENAKREQVAVALMNAYRARNNRISFKNGFYAIRSASQAGFIEALNSTSFGWSRFEMVDGVPVLNMTSSYDNEYRIPFGYEEPLSRAKANGKALLMVTAPVGTGLVNIIMNESDSICRQIAAAVNGSQEGPVFDGVVIDFENLKGQEVADGLVSMLGKLRVHLRDKLIYVAVHPRRRAGHEYFDGYDYKAIGEIADKVILMAHDYNAKRLTPQDMQNGFVTTPLAPINEIYYALRAIADKQTGVGDKSKILLQMSFDTAQWKLSKSNDGKIINSTPYNPGYDILNNRMLGDVDMHYSEKYESPYITFFNENDGSDNIVWYEDERSVAARINLAKMFGINGISVWRMGTIPNYSSGVKELYLNVLDYLEEL